MDRFPPPHPIYPPVIHYGPAPIPLRKEPHIPLTPKTGMRREEIERRLSEIDVTPEEKAAWNAKYQKPSTGIPKTDLASGVQASLGKADTALQEHQSLDGYATEEWVEDQGYLTEHQDITGKVDKSALFDNPDTTPKVKSSLLPSYVDDVLEFASLSVFPTTGETGKIYVALDTNKIYRWGGTQYVQVGGDDPPIRVVKRNGTELTPVDGAVNVEVPTTAAAIGAMPSTATGSDISIAPGEGSIDDAIAATMRVAQGKQDTISDLAAIRSGAAAGATAVQPAALSAYRTAAAQDDIDGAQDAAIAAKYTRPATGIPASDLATGVIPSVPSLPISIDNGGTGATSKNAALANLGAVKKSGDTMTGDLEVQRTSGSYTGGTVSVRSVPDGSGEALVKVAATDGAEICLDAASGYNPSIAVKRAGGELKEIEVPNNNGILALQEGIAPAFSSSSTYAVGDYVTHEGLLYKCTTAVTTAGTWDAANWSAVAVTDEMGGGVDPTQFVPWANDAKNAVTIGDRRTGQTVGAGSFVAGSDSVAAGRCSSAIGVTCWAGGNNSIALGSYASTSDSGNAHWGAFCWNGDTQPSWYKSKGTGTFCIQPMPAAGYDINHRETGFFIGENSLASLLRYAFASPTPSVSGTSATVACEDRAINDFTVATGITSLTITPPAAVTGRARDFFCRVTLTDASLPTVTLSGGTIDIGSTEVAGMTQGVNLLMFTEIASGHWLASRRSAS